MKLLLTLAALVLAVVIVVTPGNEPVRAQSPASTAKLIVVDQSAFRLRLYQRDRGTSRGFSLEQSWKVTVGRPAFPTPNGVYRISAKALNPRWTPPDSSWVPVNQRGKSFGPNDERNPIAAAFLAISPAEGLGIHGTTDRASLGSRASHGCVRMAVRAVLSLSRRAPAGTPVVITG